MFKEYFSGTLLFYFCLGIRAHTCTQVSVLSIWVYISQYSHFSKFKVREEMVVAPEFSENLKTWVQSDEQQLRR